MTNSNRAFTLIELLVVVLIIAILAAVALPQYQLAVLKSKVSSYLPLVHSMAEVNEVYYMENGQYASGSKALKLLTNMPDTCTYRGGNVWPCGTDFVFDFSEQAGIILRYCPNYAEQSFTDCELHQEMSITKFYNHSLSAGKLYCVSDTTLGKKLCKALGL